MSFIDTMTGLGMAGSAFGAVGGVVQGALNYGLQKKQFEYQKNLQNVLFQREDSAMQRRRADLEAAGLNPQLAAGGSGANAGAVVPVSAPQLSGADSFGQLQSMLALANEANNMRRTQADIARLDAETKSIDASTATKLWDLGVTRGDTFGRRSNDTGIEMAVYGIANALANRNGVTPSDVGNVLTGGAPLSLNSGSPYRKDVSGSVVRSDGADYMPLDIDAINDRIRELSEKILIRNPDYKGGNPRGKTPYVFNWPKYGGSDYARRYWNK